VRPFPVIAGVDDFPALDPDEAGPGRAGFGINGRDGIATTSAAHTTAARAANTTPVRGLDGSVQVVIKDYGSFLKTVGNHAPRLWMPPIETIAIRAINTTYSTSAAPRCDLGNMRIAALLAQCSVTGVKKNLAANKSGKGAIGTSMTVVAPVGRAVYDIMQNIRR